MSHSEVPRIELNRDGTVTLFVNVGGFEAGTPVEISGYATQTNGGVATFRDVQLMQDDYTQEGVIMVVRGVPVIGSPFKADEPVMVVAQAADAWITKLPMDTGEKPLSEAMEAAKARTGQVNIRTAWNSDEKTYHSLFSPASSYEKPPPATTLMRRSTWGDRGKPDPPGVVLGGRFAKLFPELPAARFVDTDLELLADEMTSPPEEPVPETEQDPEENPGIPAAYTYLGQFVDHDLTFDPASRLRESLTKAQLQELVDYRTPRFDLDNLYGRGPDDQPYMYREDGIRMLTGEPMSGDPLDPRAVQLPRGPNGRALIGDPRDDENRIVAQLHAIFVRFHNRVFHELGGKKHVGFQEVREQVRWHYQWILVNDFLPRILDERTYQSVFPDPYTCITTIPRLREIDLGLMPVEFSAAAYRFGHSMIRPRYRLNRKIERPIFSGARGDTADLGGFRPIPANWAIDWRFFIHLDDGAGPQLSYKIDTSLVHPLSMLPAHIAKGHPSSLALRNLRRGVTFQLPSGQLVAEALGMQPIANEDLMIGKATADTQQKSLAEVVPGFGTDAPLWTYILSEAQVTSWKNAGPVADKNLIPIRLGPVGGRLVAEVFASLLRGDPTSYLNAKARFEPIADFAPGGTFGLAELINVALRRTR